jgi:hypothetical protein
VSVGSEWLWLVALDRGDDGGSNGGSFIVWRWVLAVWGSFLMGCEKIGKKNVFLVVQTLWRTAMGGYWLLTGVFSVVG